MPKKAVKSENTEAAEAPVKKRPRGRPPAKPKTEISDKIAKSKNSPETISALTDLALECLKMPQIDPNNYEELEERVYWYFNECTKRGLKPGFAGLAAATKLSRDTLIDWRRGDRRPGQPHGKLMKSVSSILEMLMEGYMLEGQVVPLSGIFLMNNNFGYTQKQEVSVSTPNLLDNGRNMSELEQSYLESVPELPSPDTAPLTIDHEDMVISTPGKKGEKD